VRLYEMIYILSPGLDPDAAEKRAGEIQKTIENANVKVLYTESWGKRKLAYYVKKQNYGFYFFLQVEVDNEILKELDRLMKLQENVLKFIIVRLDADKVGKATPFFIDKTREAAPIFAEKAKETPPFFSEKDKEEEEEE